MIAETISHYRVLSQLGGTGAGTVYAAEDLETSRRVAIKFLPAEFGKDAAAMDRLASDIQTVSALNHPNICRTYEIGQADGQPFVVTELLEGESLKRKLNGQPWDTDEMLQYALQVADALDRAHGCLLYTSPSPRDS